MILQYFKKKENEYKVIADKTYTSIVKVSQNIMQKKYFKESNFDSSFELITILLIFHIKIFRDIGNLKFKEINSELINNLIKDLDKTLREIGIGDMSIGKYVKKYVKKFYYRVKLLDPIFDNFSEKNFNNYLNTIESIEKQYSKNLLSDLMDIFEETKKNKGLL